ncbi:hypothetical protein COO60DRAFT_759467 [Scenedesmus sp. NREL 46B-D3]|nr:hypothetical protein COO60DRAFT_759467 [Scenedesmus sp. NREL 46B-D3]
MPYGQPPLAVQLCLGFSLSGRSLTLTSLLQAYVRGQMKSQRHVRSMCCLVLQRTCVVAPRMQPARKICANCCACYSDFALRLLFQHGMWIMLLNELRAVIQDHVLCMQTMKREAHKPAQLRIYVVMIARAGWNAVHCSWRSSQVGSEQLPAAQPAH